MLHIRWLQGWRYPGMAIEDIISWRVPLVAGNDERENSCRCAQTAMTELDLLALRTGCAAEAWSGPR